MLARSSEGRLDQASCTMAMIGKWSPKGLLTTTLGHRPCACYWILVASVTEISMFDEAAGHGYRTNSSLSLMASPVFGSQSLPLTLRDGLRDICQRGAPGDAR